MALADSEERFSPHMTGDIALDHIARYIAATMVVSPMDEVLDLASGEGYGAALLATRCRRVTAVDSCLEAIQHAAERYNNPNLRYIHGDACALALNDSFFDIVTCFETIEHVSDTEKALAEIRRVMKPGGVLLISTPEKTAFNADRSTPNPYHLHEFTRDEFTDALADHWKHVAILGQRTARYSIIAPAEAQQAPMSLVIGTADGLNVRVEPHMPEPMYLFAVASDEPLRELPMMVLR